MQIKCNRCERMVVAKEEVVSNLNIKATCPMCRNYIKFVEYKNSNLVKQLLKDHYETQSRTGVRQ